MKTKKPTDRLNYTGDLKPVIDDICVTYSLKGSRDFSVIDVGYEDCNVVIKTNRGKYLAKMFSKNRSASDIQRYASIMQGVVRGGVSHPELLKNNDQQTLTTVRGISMVVMKFVDGQTFLEMDRTPDKYERQAIIKQAVKINHIDFHPPYIFDSWAIPNIRKIYDRVSKYIRPKDLGLVNQAIKMYETIDIINLPSCFVHGDFTKANILKGNDGQIYILDFSVSNWYPRIQELAVIAANLMYHKATNYSLKETCRVVAGDYSALLPLTDLELISLYPYAIAGVAMEFMGAHQEKYINGNNTEETDYWLNLGRTGLKAIFK